MAKRSNKIFRVQPVAGAAANLADVPHEGMCRGAAANAKEGCKQLAKQTAITTNKMKTERITNSKINITPLPTCVLKAYTGQRNDVGGGNEKRKKAPRASTLRGQRIVLPPWLGYPLLRWSPDQPSVGARPDSVSPSNDSVHEEKNEATNFERRRYVHSQKIRPKKL